MSKTSFKRDVFSRSAQKISSNYDEKINTYSNSPVMASSGTAPAKAYSTFGEAAPHMAKYSSVTNASRESYRSLNAMLDGKKYNY